MKTSFFLSFRTLLRDWIHIGSSQRTNRQPSAIDMGIDKYLHREQRRWATILVNWLSFSLSILLVCSFTRSLARSLSVSFLHFFISLFLERGWRSCSHKRTNLHHGQKLNSVKKPIKNKGGQSIIEVETEYFTEDKFHSDEVTVGGKCNYCTVVTRMYLHVHSLRP